VEKYFGGDVAALVILDRAWQEAEERRADVWQYAVGQAQFEAAGVPLDDLDRLRRAGLIAAREERTCCCERRRSFRPLRAGRMPPRPGRPSSERRGMAAERPGR
jgi:hypothetical protein